MTPEFFDGPISREYREILESEPHFITAPSPKAGTEGTRCKSEQNCPRPGTEGVKCKSELKACPKKHAVVQNVPGWSFPPAPPS